LTILKNEDISVFVQLGLTEQQARVYLAISRLGQATIKTTAVAAQTARAEVYRVLPELQKLGMIKKNISNPVIISAVPPSEGLAILLELEANNHKQNEKKAKQFIRHFNTKEHTSNPTINRYIVTIGESAVQREFLKDLEGLKTHTDGIFEWNEFLYVFRRYFKEYQNALERGVKIRRITNKPVGQKMPSFIQTLKESGSFEIKCVPQKPTSGMDIWDGKSACIITLSDTGRKEMEVLNLRNSAILELVGEYFEMKWQMSTPC
jgi:sugar-specific transcriptional regulator TrmB